MLGHHHGIQPRGALKGRLWPVLLGVAIGLLLPIVFPQFSVYLPLAVLLLLSVLLPLTIPAVGLGLIVAGVAAWRKGADRATRAIGGIALVGGLATLGIGLYAVFGLNLASSPPKPPGGLPILPWGR